MIVAWRASAVAGVVRIVNYITQENAVAAQEIGRELFLAWDSQVHFPWRGRPGRSGTREQTTVSPYVLVYQVDDADNVTILRVWLSAQNR